VIPLCLLAAAPLLLPPAPAPSAPPGPPLRGPVGWYAPPTPTRRPGLAIADPLAVWAQPTFARAAAMNWTLGDPSQPGDAWMSTTWVPLMVDLRPIPATSPQADPLRWADPLTPADVPEEIAAELAAHAGPPPLPTLPDEYGFRCPPLPADAKLRWRHERGADFDVCRAYPVRGGDAPRLGLYLGHWPNFAPASRTVLARTRLHGRPVRWFRAAGGGEFARETLFAAHRSHGQAFHVWIVAKSEQELSDTLRLVSRLSFE